MTNEAEELLSPDDTARLLKCSRPYIYKLISEGKLPPLFKLGERMSRQRKSDFNAAVAKMGEQ